jgi:hypothetical protein
MLSLLLIDVADPRYGGSPDPDDERRRRWEPMDKRVLLPFLGSASCLIVSSVTTPEGTIALTAVASGLCLLGARAALAPRRRNRTDHESASSGEDSD